MDVNLGRAESQPAAEWSDCAAHASGQQGVVCIPVFSGWEKIYIGKEGKMNSSKAAEWLLHNGKLMRPGLPFCLGRVRKDWSV